MWFKDYTLIANYSLLSSPPLREFCLSIKFFFFWKSHWLLCLCLINHNVDAGEFLRNGMINGWLEFSVFFPHVYFQYMMQLAVMKPCSQAPHDTCSHFHFLSLLPYYCIRKCKRVSPDIFLCLLLSISGLQMWKSAAGDSSTTLFWCLSTFEECGAEAGLTR